MLTLGTFLRSFRWGHVRQLEGEPQLLARAWAAGGPGDAPFTIDLDSTICETYGLAKEGARHHGYTGQRGYHPRYISADGPSARGPGTRRPLSTRWGGCARLKDALALMGHRKRPYPPVAQSPGQQVERHSFSPYAAPVEDRIG